MNDRINVLTQAEAWCNVLERAHVELVGSIVAIDAGSPGVRSQLERAQRAMAAAQLTHLRYLPHAGSAYLPRGYIGVIDETDRKEAFAAGAFAAQSALTGSGSVVLHYDHDRIEPLIVPLDRVAGKTRHMPSDFFAGSNAVSDDGRRYFRRLLPKRPDIFLPFL
jgi:hypothetical protein